jgi:hypothetical protein
VSRNREVRRGGERYLSPTKEFIAVFNGNGNQTGKFAGACAFFDGTLSNVGVAATEPGK